jgi:hypothetical protein
MVKPVTPKSTPVSKPPYRGKTFSLNANGVYVADPEPEEQLDEEDLPDVWPNLREPTPPTQSSPTPPEKVIETKPAATKQHQDASKGDSPRNGKRPRSSEAITPPAGWAHISGYLWKSGSEGRWVLALMARVPSYHRDESDGNY